MTFGAIGSAIEGKGKQVAVIRPQEIASFEKNMKNGRFSDYQIHLKDGRLLKLSFLGFNPDASVRAADSFLTQI